MLRTQVYLQEEQVREIDLLVALTKKKKARVIREVLEVGLKAMQEMEENDGKIGMQLRNLTSLRLPGPKDMSETMDDYLYGKKSGYAKHYSS